METIKLDLIPGKKMPSLHASQYDDGRDYHIDLTENRVPYVLDGTETISLTVRKCDNTLVTMDIANTFVGKSYIEFRTTEQMNACAGFNYGEITIEKNGTQISSLNFYLQVEGAPDEGGITSQSEINNLKRQVHDAVVEELEDNGASETGYDNTESGLEATNVQDAIDEVNTKIENIPSVDAYTKEQSDEKYATKTELSNKADISAIPTKTSQLQNDSGFAPIDDTEASASKTYSSEKIDNLVNPLTEFPSDKYWSDNALKGKLYRTFEGIATNFDVASLKPTTPSDKTYYIKPNGSDSNSGLDREHPLQKLSTAIAKSDVQTIIVMDGIYNLGRVGGSFTKGVNIIADEDTHPIFIMSRDKTWSKTNGYNYIYETTDTASAFYGVIKADTRNAEGDLLSYTLVKSLADVETTDNSYYVSDHTIYIHSESAPSKVYVLVSGVNIHATLSNGETLYIEGCEFVGGNYGGVRVTNNNANKKPTVLVKNCGFSHSYLGNAFYLQGCSGIIQNCYASYSAEDGFNYHATLDVIPDSIEINCIGRHNGTIGNNTNNGSTTHDGAKILRLNCEFFDNIGPNLADVNNSLSFNYGVVSHDSAGSSTNKSGFQCQGGVMYNDTCSAYANVQNFQAFLGGTLYQHNCSGSVDLGADGKAKAY